MKLIQLQGAFTYKVTTGEEALGKTEIFNYTIQNGTQTDTAQIIIDISGTAFDDGTLLPPDYLDQVVANDDLATVQNYYEEPGDDIGTTGGASQLLGVGLVGIDISLGSEVPFNFEVEQNTTSDVTIDVSGSVLNLGLGVLGSILGLNSPQLFNAVLERRYVDENDVSQVEYIVVPNAITLNPGVTSTYSGTVTVEDLPLEHIHLHCKKPHKM
ncbi:hypothetical protein [Acinetobacter pseudolwoffii]|uniref:hypothetical protein n=1 Tax=Acinetobacter pseudolwoffii TaxID=2053287 RepID=UPI00209F1F41|nr:hypothetical protein [Acinetobacter pseudolwoffii]MCP0912089.1 hypothetical protein [Acinetobacter pseudolwoffii]